MSATPINSMLDSQLFAAVVGALIGILPAYWLGFFNERSKEKKTYKFWLFGLSAELTHIQKCITEIKGVIAQRGTPTKRMNSDFVESARLAIFNYERDLVFLESLTNAYRDIVHTNEMLERLERHEDRDAFRPNASASMDGVERSVQALQALINQKTGKKK
jgi:hypothetical protein